MTCGQCGAQAPDGALFCPACGKPLAPAERSMDVPDSGTGSSAGPPSSNVPPRDRSTARIAAMGLFVAGLLLFLLAFGTGNSAETTRACIAAGGSGGGCPSPMIPKILFVLAIGAWGLGIRCWNR